MSVKDFVVRFANVNGTGSASANTLTTQGRVSDGHSGDAEEHFPVEHLQFADVVNIGANYGFRVFC